MADLKYLVEVDTKRAERSISSLKSTIASAGAAIASAFTIKELVQTSARFEDLRTTLGILYKDVATGAQAFDQIKQFAANSIFSVEDLTQTIIKLKAAGINPTMEQLRLFADTSSVAADSVGALQAITDLFARTTAGGLGLEDLNRLADRGIPVFDILQKKIGLNRLEISEMGKTADGARIILKALTEGLDEAFGGASAARANNLSQAFSNLQDSIANAFDAIGQAGLNQALRDATNQITAFVENNKVLIKVIGEGLGAAITFVAENAKYLAAILAGMFAASVAGNILSITKAVWEFVKGLRAAATAGAVLQGVTGVGLVKLAAGVAAAAGVVASINELTSETAGNIEGLQEDIDRLKDSGAAIPDMSAPEYTPPAIPEAGELTNTTSIIQDQVRLIQKEYADVIGAYKEGNALTVENLELQRKQIGLTAEQVEEQNTILKVTKDYQNAIKELQDRLKDLNKEPEKNAELIRAVQAEIAKVTQEYEIQLPIVTELAGEIRKAQEAEEARLKAIQEQKEAQEEAARALAELQQEQARAAQITADYQEKMRRATEDARFELQKMNMDPLQTQVAEITRDLDRDLKDKIAEINELDITDADKQAQIQRLKQITADATKSQTDLAKEIYTTQRSFSQGWKDAFNSYKDDATNAAKAAERIFNKVTSGMEDMIVNFAKTGKFEFKEFAASVLEDLLRLQVRQTIANIFGMGGAQGSFSNPFAGFFANGGMIPAGQFGVVGENGPEFVSGPAAVTPMGGMGGNVTYNINAVDAPSFKSLVARDPGFIHAVAQQGSRKIPVRR
jgi:lambda family phage tail tape measure protein